LVKKKVIERSRVLLSVFLIAHWKA